ncbi:hypothetical protein Aduo_010955 [Ancylostoma duodenale]
MNLNENVEGANRGRPDEAVHTVFANDPNGGTIDVAYSSVIGDHHHHIISSSELLHKRAESTRLADHNRQRVSDSAAGVTDDSSRFSTRMTNIFFTFVSWYMQTSWASAAEQAMVERLGSGTRPIWEIVSNMNWVLVNSEPLLDIAKPTLHSIVDIGGTGVTEAKPLTKEWNDVLSLRQATVLISFGSVAHVSRPQMCPTHFLHLRQFC